MYYNSFPILLQDDIKKNYDNTRTHNTRVEVFPSPHPHFHSSSPPHSHSSMDQQVTGISWLGNNVSTGQDIGVTAIYLFVKEAIELVGITYLTAPVK